MSTSHPILFSAPMVRAILAGTKTQTRRIVKPQPEPEVQFARKLMNMGDEVGALFTQHGGELAGQLGSPRWCPYGKPGDGLWVKETHLVRGAGAVVDHRADFEPMDAAGHGALYGGWKPSIFMRREYSRINLGVQAVRVERLQDISRADGIAEGVMDLVFADFGKDDRLWPVAGATPTRLYRCLWNAINLPPSPLYEKKVIVAYESYPWNAEDFDAAYPGVRPSGLYRGKPITVVPNPWVWVVEFKRN